MGKKLKSFLAVILMLATIINISPAYVYAEEKNETETTKAAEAVETVADVSASTRAVVEYGPGQTYYSNFEFTNVLRGTVMRITGTRMRIRVGFKKIDSQPTNIDLKVNIEQYYSGGSRTTRQANRFMSKDVAPNVDGYHYFVGDWYYLGSQSGNLFNLYYDAVTEYGKTGNGSYRQASVFVWIDVE